MKPFIAQQRGRPKSEPRAPKDYGTDQLRLRRILAVGPDADPALANTPLGIMQARGMIEVGERAAGEEYRRLYARSLSIGHEFGLDPGSGDNDDALKAITDRYNAATKLLKAIGEQVWLQVLCVAVHEEWPVWMRRALATPHKHIWRLHKHHIDFINLHDGLKALTNGRRYGRRVSGN